MPCFPTLIFLFRSSKSDVLCLACDAKELNSCLNPSANQCTKASSESCCVDRLYVIKSDWFNFPFILTRYAIG